MLSIRPAWVVMAVAETEILVNALTISRMRSRKAFLKISLYCIRLNPPIRLTDLAGYTGGDDLSVGWRTS